MKTLVTNFEYEKWIEVQSLVKAVNEHNTKYSRTNASDAENLLASLIRCIENAPFVEVAPVVHGKWVDRYDGKHAYPVFECSVCKGAALLGLGAEHVTQALSAYCPHCCAKMDLE